MLPGPDECQGVCGSPKFISSGGENSLSRGCFPVVADEFLPTIRGIVVIIF